MKILDLTIKEFEDFASNHPLRNYCQSSMYAKVMAEKGFSYEYIGYSDDSNNLVAASIILIKKIGAFYKFAYAPKGFLIDYYNTELLKMFVRDIRSYYSNRGVAFIKINPEIIIGELNPKKNYTPVYNQNVNIIDTLKSLGFRRRRELNPLDFIYPRINPYINLKTFNPKKLSDDCRNRIKATKKCGLSLEELTNKDVGMFYEIIKNNTNESINYYRNILNSFNEGNSELLLVKIDHEAYLVNAQKQYEKEVENNSYWNDMIREENTEKNITEKMNSDRELLKYKEDLVNATERLRKSKYEYIGGVIVVKYQNRVSIIGCGYNKEEANLNPNYFIYHALIERFKDDYDFLDLNGLASNFNDDSVYSVYNNEKLAFNPTIYEFIGEFDLVLNENIFNKIQAKGLLSKEFRTDFRN